MKYCDYVNIKQGSDSTRRFSNGNTLPLVQLPFGMTAFCPQTSEGNIRWYYHPKDRSLEGIRLTHQPSPWISDYGAVCFLPQITPLKVNGEDRWSGFRPADVVLSPYYLKYDLLRSKSRIELSPTERCAKLRLTFKGEDRFFSCLPVKDSYSYRFDESKNSVYISCSNYSGGDHHNFCEYVVVKFPEGSVKDVYAQKDGICAFRSNEISGNDTALHIQLSTAVTEIEIASSYMSFEQAEITLQREIGNKSFDEIKANAESIWEEYLGRITIEAEDEDQFRTFCSCMYRAFLYPHRCSEVCADGIERHYSPYDGKIYDGARFTDNGFWDTCRTVYPFFSLVAKDELKLMVKSFINDYRECGWLPRWISIGEHGCMPSTLIDAVICDAAVKGFIEKDDLETALEGMIKHATKDTSPYVHYGRKGAAEYCRLGYVPYDYCDENVNLTLDAAYGDWCIAEIAKILGKDDIEKQFRPRAKNYRNIFDKETGFMRPRGSDGKFREPFIANGWGRDYTEGSAWQNSFAVQHDMEGLAELYGGKEKLIEKMDELFACEPDYTIIGYNCEIHEITEMAAVDFGQCAISNQPSFHIPYIYSELGEVEKTAYWVEKMCKEAFSWRDDGFPGDEDNGTMAIWYIFSILGFYPFCPGKCEFVKGKKQVKKAYILGKEFDADSFEGNKIPYGSI